ncbi:MAG TPA: hypothetical protein VNB22_12745 [Pyrinomonadaceae bacterium]|jgi:hypothetical protein|nr:hypothetical protein [Pyrinomonadaceae bacterium]
MEIAPQIFWIVILSITVASVAWTVTQEEIFREPREYCEKKSEACRNFFQRKFFYVFTCEYCFSHWVTALILILTQFRLLIDDWRGYVLAFFVLPWLANQWMSIYRRLRVGIKHENLQAKIVEEKLEK